MFYSQFILAKKGPLGTIWIAAHLERKLRKNQVADTDIGVSVDSILSPDVPIALRLSSHLLLGVVKIYSRKVNYLFHDCSEALLKIKQAFRSTAVDLPPEESTAPYHSITLPETFDLDDFELPDTAFLNGNFVDHHVSTREQITLQDTLDGTGYSTSQFGLDERFGDGDASQIGLELDEELFMDRSLAFQHGSVPLASEEGLVHQDDVTTYPNEMDIEQNQYGRSEYRHDETSNLSEVLGNDRGKHVVSYVNLNRNDDSSHRLVFNIQTPDLNEVFTPDNHIGGPSMVPSAIDMDLAVDDPPSPEFMESSHAPSTPGILDEAIPANVQECSALSSRDKISPFVSFEDNNLDTSINEEVGYPGATTNNTLIHASPICPILADVAKMEPPTSVLSEAKPDSVAPLSSADNLTLPDEVNGNNHINEVPMHPDSVTGVQLSSSALVLSNQNHHSLASQCSAGLLAEPGTINASDVMHAESANPLVTSTSQMVTSPTLVLDEPIPSLASHSLGGILATPEVSHLESTAKSTESLQTVPICDEGNRVSISDQVYDKGDTILTDVAVTPAMSTDKPAAVSAIYGDSFINTLGTSNIGNQYHVKDAQSCPSSNLSTSGSEFHLRSCRTHLNQTNVLSLEDMVSAKTTPGISFSEAMEKSLHLNGSSSELQGDFHLHKSTCISSKLNFGVNDHVELSDNCISELAQTDPRNCTPSSQFPEPEKILLAPTGYAYLSSDLGKQTVDKGVTESDGSVDRISNLSGHKRHFDNTPGLQNGMPVLVPDMPRKRRYNKYIPEDNDLLASILVGRTPAFTIGPTPPLPKANSLKRPRLTSRVVFPKKRKLLQDDTMVLHADAIRQQLVNTEDTRRMRNKAPCTRPEIWRIQKSLLEDGIFSETIFTDISAELNSLLAKRFILDHNVSSKINEHSIGTSKNVEVSRSSEIVGETGEREMPVHISALPDRVDGRMLTSFGTKVLIDAQGCKDSTTIDVHQQLDSSLPSVQAELMGKNQTALTSTAEVYANESTAIELANSPQHFGNESGSVTVSAAEVYVHESRGVGPATVSSVHSGKECEIPTYSRVGEKHDDPCFNPERHSLNDDSTLLAADAYNNTKPTSIVGEDSSADMCVPSSDYPIDGHADACKTEEVGSLVSMPNNCILEVGADMPADFSTVAVHTDSSVPAAVIESGEQPHMAVTDDNETEASKAGHVTSGEESVMERPTSEVHYIERRDMPPYPVPVTIEKEHIPFSVGGNSCMQEVNLDCELVVESSPMHVAAARESSDFCSADDDLDTEFLNVDDGIDYDEEADKDLPNPESQALENSGWSSRTRGVARYLKTMFDGESGRGRKSVAIDHLVAGKTRKEASRMFFETLVLTTRDYIHVEQENPFDYISIKPRIKILKSEF